MARKLGICIVGCGWMGRVHAEGYRTLQDEVDVYYCSRTEEKAREYMEKHGGVGLFTDYGKVLESPEIDGVDICLPHDQHRDHAVRAFRNGKHVAVEKPMSMNVAEADAMVAAAEESKKCFMVAENFRYWPHLARGAELVRQQVAGEVFFIQVNCMTYYVVSGWRRPKASAGGGVLIDIGHHFVDLAVMLGGEVQSVYAQFARKTIDVIDTEDTAIVSLRYRSGVIGELNLSFGSPKSPPAPVFVAYGNKGTIAFNEQGLVVNTGDTPEIVMKRDESSVKDGWWSESIREAARDFARSIREGRQPVMTGRTGRHDMEIILAGEKSAKIGEVIRL
ncbi:MAG: Gfo/Idh/MocA family oxidoreductase [Planctomycetes bacterium]|nr:Gfo/Idh/MocA family oxidoreductase [Planctomycetota bacterium]